MTPEEIRVACQRHHCERCIPIGKRRKRDSIRDGRFDTKEDCCKTRFGEIGCPRSLEIKHSKERAEHDAGIIKKEQERVLDILNKGKDALYQIMPDGHWDQILQAKYDVLLWVEEQVQKGDSE